MWTLITSRCQYYKNKINFHWHRRHHAPVLPRAILSKHHFIRFTVFALTLIVLDLVEIQF